MVPFRWFQNGTKWKPKGNPVIKKVYFIAVTPSGHNKLFKRNVIFNTQEDIEVILIHYIGDQSVACDFPHGNAKSSQNYHRTLPSVLKRLSSEHDKPGTVYSNAVANSSICCTQHQPSVIPRNLKQIQNLQQKCRERTRLSQDDPYNVHELAYDLNSYVIKVSTYPDFVVICGLVWNTFLDKNIRSLYRICSYNPLSFFLKILD